MKRELLLAVTLLLLVLQLIPTLPTANNPQTNTIIEDRINNNYIFSNIENIFSGDSEKSWSARVNPSIIDRAKLERYILESSPLLEKVYKNLFGVDIGDNPVGLLVELDGMSLSRVKSIAQSYGGVVAKYWRPIDTVLIVVKGDERTVRSLARDLARHGAGYVGLDEIRKPAMYDSAFLLGMYSLWQNLGYDGTNVTIAILDTGVDPSHPAIPYPKYWKDFINNQTTPYDDHGHGTHVAGIALGRDFSLFSTADAMWHNILASNSIIFNPPVPWANLTYAINVSAYAGQNLTISLEHMYVLYENYSGAYYFKADASVWASFDNATWSKIAQFNGNQTSPLKSTIYVDVPPGASTLYLRFAVHYYYQANGTSYDISDWDILGWFINEIYINLTSTGTTIYSDKITNTSIPPEVVEDYYWARVEDNFRGMAPNATLAAGKVCGTTGCPDSAILEGMNWSLNTVHADIVSMSLGGQATSYDPLAQMADYLVQNGVLVVIAAGNEGPEYFNVSSPGISRLALTVGAATKGDTIAYFSSPGPSPVGGWVKPDVCGLGYEIISSITTSAAEAPPWAGQLPLVSWSGTSMATPMVAGLAALVKQSHPSWNASLVKQAIIASANWLRPSYFMSYPYDVYKQGAGLIDPHQAVNLTVVPLEANVFLGNHTAGKEQYINYTIRILNNGSRSAQVTVAGVDFYWINTSKTGGSATNHTSLVESPQTGDTIVISPGSVANITLRINISDPGALVSGYYGGHIMFNTNTSGQIKVIFGAFIKAPVLIKGTVRDYYTGEPLQGINVTVLALPNGTVAASNVTGADGSYKVIIPPNISSIVITAFEETTHYYHPYVSYNISTTIGTIIKDIYMMPLPNTTTILLIGDPTGNETLIKSLFSALQDTATAKGMEARYWDSQMLGRPVGPFLDNTYPLIVYSAGGTWYPLDDSVTRNAMKFYVNTTHYTLVLSGGDIAWNLDGIDNVFLKHVLHANYSSDLNPSAYQAPVYNKTPLLTVFGFQNFVHHLGSANNTIIGNLSIQEIPSHYPDSLAPVNNGTTVAGWNVTNGSSIVAYYGNGTETARTLAIGFELYQLPENQLASVLDRIIAWATDYTPPLIGHFQLYKAEGTSLTLLPPDPANLTGIYDPNLLGYQIQVYAQNNTAPIATLYTPSLPYTIDLSALSLTEGQVYTVSLTAWDAMARASTLDKAAIFRYYTTMIGDIIRITAPETLEQTVSAGPGGSILVKTAGPANIQLTEVPLTSIPPVPAGLAGTAVYRNVVPLDLFATQLTSNSILNIKIKLNIPSDADPSKISEAKLLWWNGTTWLVFSNYTVDTINNTIIANITNNTSPSIDDLQGTPIILVYPVTHIGGELLDSKQNFSIEIEIIIILLISTIIIRKITYRK